MAAEYRSASARRASARPRQLTPPRGFGGRRGIANAFGAKGVSVQCEYQIVGSMGTGACRLSDGARYQMHFGT
jgi:hypothetical protein